MARGYAPTQGLLYTNGTLSPEPPTSSSETRTYAKLLTSGVGLTTAQDQMPGPGLGISGRAQEPDPTPVKMRDTDYILGDIFTHKRSGKEFYCCGKTVREVGPLKHEGILEVKRCLDKE